jgi:hypothetical protein
MAIDPLTLQRNGQVVKNLRKLIRLQTNLVKMLKVLANL